MKFLGACSAFSFLGVYLEAGLVNLLLCYKCILKYILPTEDYRKSTAGWLGNLNSFWICFSPSLFSLWCYDGPVTDWSLVCMSFWIQRSSNRIDLSVRFTSKYIKNAHFVFLPLRKGNQRTTDMPVPRLFSFSYNSEIRDMRSGRFRIYPLLSWDAPEHIFSREWPAPTVYQVLLGRIMRLLHQILSLVTHPTDKVFEKQQGDEISQYSEYLSLFPSSKVPAGQIKQSPHFAAALCLGQNPGSSASHSNCPPMSQTCVVNPGPGIEGNKEP